VRPLPLLAFAAASAVPLALEAAPVRPAAEQSKIDYLLGEVKNAKATFLRNGREHTPARAAAHLARKLKFAGRRVQTVRDFIVGIATRSSDSGKIYEVRWPDGRKQPLGDWLMKQLVEYEKRAP
jgi:hypothetical protein